MSSDFSIGVISRRTSEYELLKYLSEIAGSDGSSLKYLSANLKKSILSRYLRTSSDSGRKRVFLIPSDLESSPISRRPTMPNGFIKVAFLRSMIDDSLKILWVCSKVSSVICVIRYLLLRSLFFWYRLYYPLYPRPFSYHTSIFFALLL